MASQGYNSSSQNGDLRFNATLQDNVSPQVDAIVKKMQQLGASKHEIKVFIRAYDETTAKAKQIRAQLDSMPKEVKSRITFDTAEAHRKLDEFRKMAEKPVTVAINIKDAGEEEFRKIRSYFSRVKQEAINSMQDMPALSSLMGVSQTLGNYGLSMAGLGGGGLIAGGAAFAQQAISQQSQMEQDIISLKATLKDLSQAQSEMVGITRFARRTPFNQPDVLQSDIMMRNYGINPQGPVGLKTAGNMAAAFGRPLGDSTLAIADAVRRGDFRMLGGFGVNMRMEDFGPGGRFQGQSIQTALGSVVEKRFGGAMQEQAKTLSGITSNLQDVMNLSLIRPSGATGFNIIKQAGASINDKITGNGMDSADFQRKLGEITQAINNMTAKFYAGFKEMGSYFKNYLAAPLKTVTSNLTEVGMTFSKVFSGTSLTILQTFADTFTQIAQPLSKIANTKFLGTSFAGIEAFGKSLQTFGFKKTGQPFADFPKDLLGMHPLKAFGDIFQMAGQAPKLLLMSAVKDILEMRQANEAVENSYAQMGKTAESSLDAIKSKLDQLGVSLDQGSTKMREFWVVAAGAIPGGTPHAGKIATQGAETLATLDKLGYGSAQPLVLAEAKRLGTTGGMTVNDMKKAGANVEQSVMALAKSMNLSQEVFGKEIYTKDSLEKAIKLLNQASVVYAEQIRHLPGKAPYNASILAQMQQSITKDDLSKNQLNGNSMFGDVQNPEDLIKGIAQQFYQPSAAFLKKLDQSGTKVTDIWNFGKGPQKYGAYGIFNPDSNAQAQGLASYPEGRGIGGQGMGIRDILLENTRTERTRERQLKGFDRDAVQATGLDINLPKPENQFFKYDVGVHKSAFTGPEGLAKEMIRYQDVIKNTITAQEDAASSLAQLGIQQQHLSLIQDEVNFKFQNFQYALHLSERAIQELSISVSKFSLQNLRPLEREMTRLQNTMSVYQHNNVVPVQRAQEDFNHVMAQTSYRLEDVNFQMSQAQYTMDKYSSGLVTGEQALLDQIHALDLYQKKLQLLKLQNMGMMADLTKTTFEEGYTSTVKPLMGFSLERQMQIASIKQQKAQLEYDVGPGEAHYQIAKAMRSEFQRTEHSLSEIMSKIKPARKELDAGVIASHNLSVVQHEQSVHTREFANALYDASVHMRHYEDAQYSLQQRIFHVNEQLADMQDHISKLSLDQQSRALEGSKKYEDAQDRLRHKAYWLNRELLAQQLLVGQLEPLTETARQTYEKLGKAFDNSIRGGSFESYLANLKKIHALNKPEASAFLHTFNAPTDQLAQSLKGMHLTVKGIADDLVGMVFNPAKWYEFGQTVKDALKNSGVPSVLATAAGVGVGIQTGLFVTNAARIGIMRGTGLGVRTALGTLQSKTPLLKHLGFSEDGLMSEEGWLGSRFPGLRPAAGENVMSALGRLITSSTPTQTLFKPSRFAWSKGIELPFNILGMGAFGPPGYLLGSAAGYAYETGAGPGTMTGRALRGMGLPIGRPGRIDRGLYKAFGEENVAENAIYKRLVKVGLLEGPESHALEKMVQRWETLRQHLYELGTNPKIKLSGEHSDKIQEAIDKIESHLKDLADKTQETFTKEIQPAAKGLKNRVGKFWEKLKSDEGFLDAAAFKGTGSSIAESALGKGIKLGLNPLSIALAVFGGATNTGIGASSVIKSLQNQTQQTAQLHGPARARAELQAINNALIMMPEVSKSGGGNIVENYNTAQKMGGKVYQDFLKDPNHNIDKAVADNLKNTLLEQKKAHEEYLSEYKDYLAKVKLQRELMIQQEKWAAKERKRINHEMGKGIALIEDGIQHHNLKAAEQGYDKIHKLTGLKLTTIKATAEHLGYLTGQDYADALQDAIRRKMGLFDPLDLGKGPGTQHGHQARISADAVSGKLQEETIRRGRQFQSPMGYLAYVNSLADKGQDQAAPQDKLVKKFSDIEASTKNHLQRLQGYYDGFNTTFNSTQDKNFWQPLTQLRTTNFADEVTSYNTHLGNIQDKVNKFYDPNQGTVPDIYRQGWQNISSTTNVWLGKVEKEINGISGDLGITSPPKHAHGGLVDGKKIGAGHLVRVGEEGYPEMIIPLAPHRRDRAQRLMDQTASYLGQNKSTYEAIPKFAAGGLSSPFNQSAITQDQRTDMGKDFELKLNTIIHAIGAGTVGVSQDENGWGSFTAMRLDKRIKRALPGAGRGIFVGHQRAIPGTTRLAAGQPWVKVGNTAFSDPAHIEIGWANSAGTDTLSKSPEAKLHGFVYPDSVRDQQPEGKDFEQFLNDLFQGKVKQFNAIPKPPKNLQRMGMLGKILYKDYKKMAHKWANSPVVQGVSTAGGGTVPKALKDIAHDSQHVFSFREAEALWRAVGGPPSAAEQMARIVMAESGGRPWIGNNNRDPNGVTVAAGLWQILGLPFPGDPTDPWTNARMALSKFKSAKKIFGNGFAPWAASKGLWGSGFSDQELIAKAGNHYASGGLTGFDNGGLTGPVPTAAQNKMFMRVVGDAWQYVNARAGVPVDGSPTFSTAFMPDRTGQTVRSSDGSAPAITYNPTVEQMMFGTYRPYASKNQSLKNAINIILHEMVHAKQSMGTINDPTTAEGGAVSWAEGHTRDFLRSEYGKKVGPGGFWMTDDYKAKAKYVRDNLGKDWINSGQFTTPGALAGGLAEVPRDDFPAMLHKGEAVLPQHEASMYRKYFKQYASTYKQDLLSSEIARAKRYASISDNGKMFNSGERAAYLRNAYKRGLTTSTLSKVLTHYDHPGFDDLTSDKQINQYGVIINRRPGLAKSMANSGSKLGGVLGLGNLDLGQFSASNITKRSAGAKRIDAAGVRGHKHHADKTSQEVKKTTRAVKDSAHQQIKAFRTLTNTLNKTQKGPLKGITTVAKRLSGVNAELNKHTKQLSNVNSELNHHTKQISAINAELNRHTKQLSNVNDELNHHRVQLKNINDELNRHTRQNSGINAELNTHTRQLRGVNAELNTQTRQIAGVNDELNKQTFLLTGMIGRLDDLIKKSGTEINVLNDVKDGFSKINTNVSTRTK